MTVAESIVTGRPPVHSTVKYAKVGFCGSLLLFFAHKKLLGRTETRTLDRMYLGSIRSVRYISRDDRARIATCSLRTPTDRLMENYSIDSSTVEPLTNDHPHQRPSLSYDHILCDGQCFLLVYKSLTSDHPSYTTTPM